MIKTYAVVIDDVVRQVYLHSPPSAEQLIKLFEGEGLPDITDKVLATQDDVHKIQRVSAFEFITKLLEGEGAYTVYDHVDPLGTNGYWYVSIDEFESEVGGYNAS